MVPVRQAGDDQLVEVTQHRLERLTLLGRRVRQSRANVAGRDARRDGQVGHSLQVRVRPVRREIEIVAERHRFFFSFWICAQVRVFSTSSFVSHARRAWPTPSST